MISLKTPEQLRLMREAGRITAETLLYVGEIIREGMTTLELDRQIRQFIERHGATPSFLGYNGFPGSACISLNDEVIHGIPSKKRIIREGDLVKVDVGACWRGYHGDSARTYPIGQVSEEAKSLLEHTRESFFCAMKVALAGNRVGDIGSAVDTHIRTAGFSVVREFVGHGIGAALHEEPDVPNYGTPGRGARLYPGMVIAVEPMVNAGAPEVRVLSDGWTVVTKDGSLSAHYENTIAITDNGPMILTEA
ncbi:MAG: type I methionyl aminopeptidase [Clostridia bacterium]|nr:type I methionyl aminopeptidase [Clostridia bacterium]